MSKELTYILGAGASFQSIPIVKSFPNRFLNFLSHLDNRYRHPKKGSEPNEALKYAYEIGLTINEAFNEHQSFDTYFKKLFHTAQFPKIRLTKKYINLYFLWEHLSKPYPKPGHLDESIFWKQSTFDKRYDALIAGLLKPINGKAKPFCPINFITWNYDLNLFLSLKNYFAPQITIGEFLDQIKSKDSESIWEVNDLITIINMNGYFYSSLLADETDLINVQKELYDLIEKKFYGEYLSLNYQDKDAELIKFAWEQHSEKGDSISEVAKKANEKISLSENIVVIGYTFPLYNRLVDFAYFNGATLADRNIYIQDPNANELKNSLIADFNIRIDRTTGPKSSIKEFSKCDSFVIPSTIYKYKDSLGDIL